MNTDTIRKKYLDFFHRQGHKIVPSSSLVPIDDPTLLFTTAGMNQFKKEFLGQKTDFRRAASSQRCLRTDDLDKVGITSYHHTFFEMLGNFSFGDYFKKEAIAWAWDFILDELKITSRDLWVSVYQEDDESYNLWKKISGLPDEKIVRLGPKDNFWPQNALEAGPNGPCGPCSEIFYDYGPQAGCKKNNCKPGCDCSRFVEIWNLVFTQYDRKEGGKLEKLPNKNIDTGMGLERIASVLQGVKSNFKIDIFLPIIEGIKENLTDLTPDACRLNSQNSPQGINAIADHIRAVAFAVYDGVIPSNEQRGYVVRKLIRKAGFHGYNLGIRKPFLYKLIPAVGKAYRLVYPDLDKRREDIANVVLAEEKLFSSTLKDAPKILTDTFKIKNLSGTGHLAFKLHDTYGIPIEITKSWAKANDLELNENEFLNDLKNQQERSKKSSKIHSGIFVQEAKFKDLRPTKFLGYKSYTAKAKILALLSGEEFHRSAQAGSRIQLVLNQSPFYGASGGQIGDRGKITSQRALCLVSDTQGQDKVLLHTGTLEKGTLRVGEEVSCEIDLAFRRGIMRSHTATHLLHYALRKVLGDHVRQAGSLVESDRLRFDFTHFKQVSQEELKRVEQLIQGAILAADKISIRETTLEKAKKTGALAFFAEKYNADVRLVAIGNYSKELCGGTHLSTTAGIGLIKIISESAIAKGIRRIEALVGMEAARMVWQKEELLTKITQIFKTTDEKLALVAESKLNELASLEKRTQQLELNLLQQGYPDLLKETQEVAGVRVLTNKYREIGIQTLRQFIDFLKTKFKAPYAICLASTETTKAWLVIGLATELVKKGFDAGKIIKDIAPILDGDGGGRSDMAQAGGAGVDKIEIALDKFKEIIKNKLA